MMADTVAFPERWRLVQTPPADGASNMAVDLTLMDVARREQVGILRVYGWSRPTVSFGRNERVAGVYSADALADAGLEMVRRPTGGRALLHDREVTYSVSLPIDDQTRWPAAYAAVNACLLRAMQQLGVPARIAERQPVQATDRAPHELNVVCFSGIAPGEIAVENRKLVASSVWRERGAYLQHGSILIHDDQARLGAVMGQRMVRPEPAATLAEWMAPGMSDRRMTEAAEIALGNAFDGCGKVVPWSIPTEVRQQVDVTRLALADSGWLWRR